MADASRVAHLPPVSTLFAAFLGYSPMQHLLGPTVLAHLPHGQRGPAPRRGATSRNLISSAFAKGLHAAFDFAIIACLVAAGASWLRGGKYVYREPAGAGDGQAPGRAVLHPRPARGAAVTVTPAARGRRAAQDEPRLRIGEMAKETGAHPAHAPLLGGDRPAPAGRPPGRRGAPVLGGRARAGRPHP